MTTSTVSLKDHRDWRPNGLPESVVYVGRRCYMGGWRLPAHPLGNPYPVAEHGLYRSLRLYTDWIATDPGRTAAAKSLHGLTLACFCRAGDPCHAQILAAMADGDIDGVAIVLDVSRAAKYRREGSTP